MVKETGWEYKYMSRDNIMTDFGNVVNLMDMELINWEVNVNIKACFKIIRCMDTEKNILIIMKLKIFVG